MATVEQKIQEFENRPMVITMAEQASRAAQYRKLEAINKFEGMVPGATDRRLFKLLSTGKVTKQEYLDLCLDYVHNLKQ